MKQELNTTIIIERRTVTRDYGTTGNQIIVDHPKHGRLLLQDGFGGIDSLAGGTVRWRHGLINRLHNDDTFSALDEPWNDHMSTLFAVEHGHDDSRPVLLWEGCMLAQLAKSIGL